MEKEKFRFGNWGTIPHANSGYGIYKNNPNYCTDEEWNKLKVCGFNYAIQAGGEKFENTLIDLEFAERAGIKILPKDHSDGGITPIIMLGLDYESTKIEIKKREDKLKHNLDSFKKYKSFAGINAYDEPATDKYEAILACKEWFSENYPEYEYYVNLLPIYAPNELLFGNDEIGTYEDYVKRFADIVKPKMLCYDNYSLAEDSNHDKYVSIPFIYNFSVFAKECKDRNLPFYVYIQTLGFYDNIEINNFSEFAYQAYIALTFGVKGIMCFQYWTILEDGASNVRGGIVERDGTITPLYGYVQRMFNRIKAFENEYMDYKWNGVKTYAYSEYEEKMFNRFSAGKLATLRKIAKVEAKANILIGEFKKGMERSYIVTNVDIPYEPKISKVNIEFNDVRKIKIYIDDEAKDIDVENNKISINLESGSGAFIIIKE